MSDVVQEQIRVTPHNMFRRGNSSLKFLEQKSKRKSWSMYFANILAGKQVGRSQQATKLC